MSVIVATGLVVTGSGTIAQLTTDSFGSIKQTAAMVLNGSQDPTILALAGTAVNRVIRDLNLHRTYVFNRLQQVDQGLVAGQANYSLEDDAYLIEDVLLVKDGVVQGALEYDIFEVFNQKASWQGETGRPAMWTLFNRVRDRELMVYPTPDAGAEDYSIRVVYRQKINQLSQDTDMVPGPDVLSEVLVAGAEYYLLWLRERRNIEAWTLARRIFEDKRDDLIRVSENPTGKPAMRRIDFVD